jgi:4-diphosphocytidyl-2-C-methyl-D-erythritol kinase
MLLFPSAKINLGLFITEKRADNYHNINTVMYPVPFHDILEILPAQEFTFSQSGLQITGNTEDNLCVKAYERMKKAVKKAFPVKIHLHKQIPMGAGLGGGSSDASHVLLGLNTLWDSGLSGQTLENLALEMGSDCPFFIQNKVRYCRSKGEFMEPIALQLKGYWLKILSPNLYSNTQEAYQSVTPRHSPKTTQKICLQSIDTWKEELKNDFEPQLFYKYPDLAKLKKQMYAEGAVFVSMTGSGTSLYGIYVTQPAPSRYAVRVAVHEKIILL